MKIEDFVTELGADFFTGVPDSQLKALCDYLMVIYGIDPLHHIVAANEGNCVALAAGYHLATERIPVVYLQNSGEGNIINPVASLINEKVYAIPMIFVIGWRGEPGAPDEPQHIYQGEVTLKLLDDMGIEHFIVGEETTREDISCRMKTFQVSLSKGKQVAFVVRRNALEFDGNVAYSNGYSVTREEAIRHITAVSEEDIVISTTGKSSRELYEIRESIGQGHEKDFLTVGSMGHSSSVALGLAIHCPMKKVWCIDGDGALLMHMGAMAVIGAIKPKNFIHVVINNGAHESVGGVPTVISRMDLMEVARGCGYPHVYSVDSLSDLDVLLSQIRETKELAFVEVRCAIGARKDLGRPVQTPVENKKLFMGYLT